MKRLTGRQIGRVLRKQGWVMDRVKGSHHIFTKADRPETIVVVPVHASRTLKIGTQRAIMKAAGLAEADLS